MLNTRSATVKPAMVPFAFARNVAVACVLASILHGYKLLNQRCTCSVVQCTTSEAVMPRAAALLLVLVVWTGHAFQPYVASVVTSPLVPASSSRASLMTCA